MVRAPLRNPLVIGAIVVAGSVGAYVATNIAAFVIQRSQPGTLTIHCDPAVCKAITVTKEGQPELVGSKARDGQWLVTPISHGPYTFDIRLADRRTVRTGYFHLDAGERKRVDVYITRPSSTRLYLKVTGYNDNSFIDEATIDLSKPNDNPAVLSSP